MLHAAFKLHMKVVNAEEPYFYSCKTDARKGFVALRISPARQTLRVGTDCKLPSGHADRVMGQKSAP